MAALLSFTGTAAGSVNVATASLVSSSGLVVTEISADLSDAEKVAAAESQLATTRGNCAGMDSVASSLETLLASSTLTVVCADKFDSDCSSLTENSALLVSKLFKLTSLASANLEDSAITTLSAEIVTLISEVKIISLEQRGVIMSCISTIQFTVFVFVSQISIIESSKLEIAGALTFPGATASIFDLEESGSAEAQITVLKVQLTNLFQINNANDAVIDCITTLEGLPAAADPKPNPSLQSEVNKVPAMCGAPEPPVSEVQTTAASIVKTCASATQQPTAAELKTLIFIKQSLITFKQTFTSQITVFSNKMTALSDLTVTAASLSVSLISATGEIAVAEAVDITGGNTVGSLEFYVLRFEVLQGALNAIVQVLAKLTQVLALTSAEEAGSSVGVNFALLISQLTASLSSGVITTDIITISISILKMEVTALPSPAIVGVLQSALSSAQSLQISILAQITNIQLKITELAGSSLSTVSFTITDISASGETSQFTVSALSSSTSETSETVDAFKVSQTALVSVETLVKATLTLDFSAISTAVTEVSITQFLVQISSFLVELGTNVISDNVLTLSQALLKLKINITLSQSIKSKVQFILYLFRICEMMIVEIITTLTGVAPPTSISPPASPPSPTTFTPSKSPSTPGSSPTPPDSTGSSTPVTIPPTPPPTTPPTTSMSTRYPTTTTYGPLTTRGPSSPTTTGPPGSGRKRSSLLRVGIWNRHRGMQI